MPSDKENKQDTKQSHKPEDYREKEVTNKQRREEHNSTIKDNEAPLFDRAKALGGAVIDGAAELTSGCKREYHSHKASKNESKASDNKE